MPIFLLGLGALAILLFGSSAMASQEKLYGLKDIEPKDQGGGFKQDSDSSFTRASNLTGVPFALIKAHAIAESSLKPSAFRDESGGRAERAGWASRGLMQILWWPNSDRFKKYGYPDSVLGADGGKMFEPDINTEIAAKLIRDNLNSVNGNLRDAINMYNTGKTEAQYKAPYDYVNKVISNYEKIVKGTVV